MKIVTVIPLKKSAFREDLTYFSAQEIPSGAIVSVTLRNKKILALVVSSLDVTDAKRDIKDMSFNLKKITEVKERSIFRPEYLDSAFETGEYFVANKNYSLASLVPSIFREEYDKISKFSANGSAAKEGVKISVNNRNIRSDKLLFQAPLEERISFYKTLIRTAFAEKKSVFIVLPTEHDIKTYSETLSKGIEKFTFSMHGGVSSKKILENFKEIVSEPHPILILGTTPFLSIPRYDLGTIILEHESTNIYNMIARPQFDLRVFVEIFAGKIYAKLILGDTLLRLETIARREIDGIAPLNPPSFRTNFEGEIMIPEKKLPARGETAEKFKILSDESVENIHTAISKKKNVFIFALRKGLATMTVCNDCKEPVMCDNCMAPVVLYVSRDGTKRMFICNRCHTEKSPQTVCENCGSWNLAPLGIGTDTVYEEIKKLFPHISGGKVLQLDKEVAKNASGAEKITEEFENNPGSILVGTEMALFYLEERAPLSIIASFDSLWSIPNFKMSEKIIQIILSILSNTKDKLIIQTKNESDPAIMAIKTDNLLPFVRSELEDRKKLEYPPYKRFIKITHLGDKQQAQEARRVLAEMFKEYSPEIFGGFVAKLKGKYVTNALIKLDTNKWSLPELSLGGSIDKSLSSKLSSLPPMFSVNVDPEDLL